MNEKFDDLEIELRPMTDAEVAKELYHLLITVVRAEVAKPTLDAHDPK